MQTDPVGYGDDINWYLYCGNNPIVRVDPKGRCSNIYQGYRLPANWSGAPSAASVRAPALISSSRSGFSNYAKEIFTLPWNIGDEAERIQKEEYPEYINPFWGDYRHFLAGGMAARICGPVIGAAGILWAGDNYYVQFKGATDWDTVYDARAEWRGYFQALRHPFTPLRDLGKDYTVRPIGPKKEGN
jgi:hypothetical protein